MKKCKIEKAWAITGTHGLYAGMWFTRRAAIKQHCTDLGVAWKYCRSNGDRCVKVEIREVKL